MIFSHNWKSSARSPFDAQRRKKGSVSHAIKLRGANAIVIMLYGNRTQYSSDLRKRITLDGVWRCAIDPDDCGGIESYFNRPLPNSFPLTVPGYIQSADCLSETYPSDVGANGYRSTFWMQTSFSYTPIPDTVCLLTIGGVCPFGRVFLNGMPVGEASHGLVSTVLDLTAHVREGENLLTIRVEEKNVGLLGGMRYVGFWSGIFRTVFIETRSRIHIEAFHGKTDLTAGFCEVQCQLNRAVPAKAEAVIDGKKQLLTSEDGVFSFRVDAASLPLWSPESPTLVPISLTLYEENTPIDHIACRLGFRELLVEKDQFLLNRKPLFLYGAGSEYLSPMLCPLTDKATIRRRFQALREDGFNFYRFHTSLPTEEELEIAEEMGILLSDEVSVLSNFNQTEPFEEGLVMLREHIRQTRSYASMAIYCLGNEGSQLMIYPQQGINRNRARAGYQAIREETDTQLAIVAFGMQGELPELPNDFETPHLWSCNFITPFDNLTQVPWEQLHHLNQKPCVIHEYGKFGQWPDPLEEAAYPKNGYRKNFASQAHQTLEELGLASHERQLIENSRKLSAVCWKGSLEGARQLPAGRGYVAWTYFRGMSHSSGFADDFGNRHDTSPEFYREHINAPLAILTDRNFGGRNLRSGSLVSLSVFLSNFSGTELSGATLYASLRCGEREIASGKLDSISISNGCNQKIGELRLALPIMEEAASAELSMKLIGSSGHELAKNSWNYWIFPQIDTQAGEGMVLDMIDAHTEREWKRLFPLSQSLSETDGMVRGCRVWGGKSPTEILKRYRPKLIISDNLNANRPLWENAGIPIFYYDTGHYPKEWYSPLLSEVKEPDKDPSCFYAPFRTGWDQGNLGTLVEALPAEFPHEGWCDLNFFGMLQGTRTLNPTVLRRAFEGLEETSMIRGLCKLRVKSQPHTIVQDPQALREIKIVQTKIFDAREQLYLTRFGKGVTISALRMLGDIAGEHLLRALLDDMMHRT